MVTPDPSEPHLWLVEGDALEVLCPVGTIPLLRPHDGGSARNDSGNILGENGAVMHVRGRHVNAEPRKGSSCDDLSTW